MSLCGALALIISAAAALSGWEVQPLPALTVAVVSGVLLALALAYYRVSVAADGLKCYDAFGIYHFAAWPTVERVRPLNLLGLRYLLVRSSAVPRALWVPLFLADLPGFRAAVAQHAGPTHPLAEALRHGRARPGAVTHRPGE
jgi:hypothetical protein